MLKKKVSFVLLSSLIMAACANNETASNNETSTNESENVSQQSEASSSTEESTSQENEASSEESSNEVEEPLEDCEYVQNYESTYRDDLLEQFDQVDNDIDVQMSSGDYSLENPMVELNPYGTNPLAAFVGFSSDEAVDVHLTVKGSTPETDISHTFTEEEGDILIPVLGLRPAISNSVEIELTDENGEVINSNEVTIETDELPENFWDFGLATESQTEQMRDGITFMTPARGNQFALDSQGEVRYLIEPFMANVFTELENGNFVLSMMNEETGNYDLLVEMTRFGRPVNMVQVVMDHMEANNNFHHDLAEDQDGNWLVTIHDGSESYIEDEVALIEPDTGEVLDNFSYREHYPSSFYIEYDGMDWYHNNTLAFTGDTTGLLSSSRHQDVTSKYSYPEMEFDWILAAHEGWPEEFEQYLLEPLHEDFKFPGAQHAPEEMPDLDNNPDTIDIMLFDNNTVIERGDESQSGEYSRAVQYRINEEEMTVEEVWSWGEERGENFFSRIVGDADYFHEEGNALITSGRIEVDEDNPESRVVEVDMETGEVLFEAVVTGFEKNGSERRQTYRAERLPLYPIENGQS